MGVCDQDYNIGQTRAYIKYKILIIIYALVKPSPARQCAETEKDLDSLQAWSESWQLRFTVAKCKVMHLGKQQSNGDGL